jgi:LuxR family maltose regulon positive regulatory protein
VARNATKRTTQPRERRIIERPRLLRLLDEIDAPVVLVVAPAGYGKTTLLRQWIRGRSDVWWYSASSGASDPAELAAGLALALDPLHPGVAHHLDEVLPTLINPSRQVEDIVRAFDVALAGRPTALGVIDDYHLVAENRDADELVRALRVRKELRLVNC